MAELPGGTVTFLFTDIEGSTRLLQELGDAYPTVLEEHRRLLRAAIAAHGGREVDAQGDGFFVAFARASDAVAAAVEAQRGLAAHEWPGGAAVRVRMGLHTGQPALTASGYVGLDVHRAARLASTGHGGQVLLSDSTRALAEQDLPTGVTLRSLGEHRLKDLDRPEHVSQLVIEGLPFEFPSLRTLDARPNNLPIQRSPLIGREREVAEVRHLLLREDVGLVTLTGPGGTGKTRLALQAAADLLDEFADGVFFVGLAPIRDPDLVPSAIAQALGVREAADRPLLDSLKDYLRPRALLLVLDNFEQVLGAAPLVADLLASCSGLKVLVTSRAVLRLSGERDIAVPPLGLPARDPKPSPGDLTQSEAARLFVERARATGADLAITADNAPAVAEICHRLDGLPLAIELAAARVRLLPPEALLARLGRRLPLLTGGARDLPARQRTLRDAIAWSHDLLADAERALFRRLAVFVGGWSLEAAEAVCAGWGVPDLDVLEGIGALVDQSLVRQQDGTGGEPRFGMLETVREYALDQLETSGEAAEARLRHAEHVTEFAAIADRGLRGADWRAWLARLEAEHDNLRAALAWAGAEPGRAEAGLRLAGSLAWFWYVRLHLAEGRRWLEGALAAHDGSPTADRAAALSGAALLAENQGDYGRAEALLDEALRVSRSLGHPPIVAWALTLRGLVLRSLGEYERASASLGEALDLWREAGEGWGERVALIWGGSVARVRGDYGPAREMLEEGLALSRSAGDAVLASRALLHLGLMDHAGGDDRRAAARVEEALAAAREIGSSWGVAVALQLLAVVLCARGEPGRAEGLGREALALYRDLGDKRGVAQGLRVLGRAVVGRGDLARAARLIAAEAALRAAIGARPGLDLRAEDERDLALIRAGLGEERFAAEWEEGRAMPTEEAVAYALADPPPARGD